MARRAGTVQRCSDSAAEAIDRMVSALDDLPAGTNSRFVAEALLPSLVVMAETERQSLLRFLQRCFDEGRTESVAVEPIGGEIVISNSPERFEIALIDQQPGATTDQFNARVEADGSAGSKDTSGFEQAGPWGCSA